MSNELKIKAKSLAAEAHIIRHQERKARKAKQYAVVNTLNVHRTGPVRMEARSTHLARAFLNGRTYGTVENKTRQPMPQIVLVKVAAMATRYGPSRVAAEDVAAWVEAKTMAAKAA